MDFLDQIDIYPKIILALTGFLAAFIKVKESYSITKQKQDIKLDLEIYDLLNKSGDFENKELKKSIEARISRSINNEHKGLTNFFVGLVVFVGFGLWTIDIFQSNENFNGWIILTLFCSLVGFSVLFGKNDKEKSKELFYQIGFYDKSNFQFGFVIIVLTGILTPIMILKMDGFSFWQFLSGLFFIIGLLSIIKNIRRIK